MSEELCVVALDLSLTGTGVARFRQGRKPEWAVKGTPPAKAGLPDHLWQCERNGILLNFVKAWITEFPPRLVVIEDVFQGGGSRNDKSTSFGGGGSALPLSQLAGLIRYWIWAIQKIPFVLVVGASSKKFAGVPKSVPGQARPKGLICKYALSGFDVDTDNDNAADAVVMSFIGGALLGLWQPRTKAQAEVVAGILKREPWLLRLRVESPVPSIPLEEPPLLFPPVVH
jgi:hypothetical protein